MKFVGIDNDWQADFVIGIAFGLSLLIVQVFLSISIIDLFINLVYPSLPFALSERFLLVVLVAPLIEEPIFRGILPVLLSKQMSPFLAERLSNVIFSLFHLLVYGVAAISAFVGAYVLGEMCTWLKNKHNSQASGIGLHAAANFVITSLKYVVVG